VDRRIVPDETADSVLAQAEAEIREALRHIPEARFQLRPIVDSHGRRRYYPPNLTGWESRIVQAALRAHKAVTGEDAGLCTGSFGASDGRLFRYQGIDTIAYGPSGENAHGPNEYVEIDTLQTQYKVLMATLSGILLEA
jgi:succinyl-diaminopimelate desuccinylase